MNTFKPVRAAGREPPVPFPADSHTPRRGGTQQRPGPGNFPVEAMRENSIQLARTLAPACLDLIEAREDELDGF